MAEDARCPLCLGTGLATADRSLRRLDGLMLTWDEMLAQFRPCPVCADGERERVFWREMQENMAS